MDQIQYIGKQIRRYRKERNWSAGQLGQMVEPKKTESAVTSWERGRTQPDGDILIQLCRLFEVDVADFYYDPPAFEEKTPSWVEVPLYGAIAAGDPIEMDKVENTFVIPAPIRKRYPKAFLLKVEGESMNRKLPNGSYALIDPTDEVVSGNAYAVCVNGYDATIKRVKKLDNGFELIPDSTDPTFKSKVYDYGVEGTETVTVIGEVVWCVYPFDYDF